MLLVGRAPSWFERARRLSGVDVRVEGSAMEPGDCPVALGEDVLRRGGGDSPELERALASKRRVFALVPGGALEPVVDAWLRGALELLTPARVRGLDRTLGEAATRSLLVELERRGRSSVLVTEALATWRRCRLSLGTKELAESLGTTPRTLARHFKAWLGRTPGRVRSAARAQLRDELLAAGQSVQRVAELLDCASAKGLQASIRHETGLGVRAWRTRLEREQSLGVPRVTASVTRLSSSAPPDCRAGGSGS